MSQVNNLIHLFRGNGNRLTLDFLTTKETQYVIGTKYTGRISEGRQIGYDIICHANREHPAQTVYELTNPDHEPFIKNCQCRKCHVVPSIPAYYPKGQGQGLFVLGV
jgi:hypothetical protein